MKNRQVQQELARHLKVKELPECYQEIARIVGVENMWRLAEHFGGAPIYLPKLDALLREIRDNAIEKEFDGFNTRQLAKKFGLSAQRVRDILKGRG